MANLSSLIPSLSLTEIMKEDGVRDLWPLKARGAFARAIKACREERYAEADQWLDEAVALDEPNPNNA